MNTTIRKLLASVLSGLPAEAATNRAYPVFPTLAAGAPPDVPSPLSYRVHGVVVNMPEFAETFACRAGQPMVKPPEQVCRVW